MSDTDLYLVVFLLCALAFVLGRKVGLLEADEQIEEARDVARRLWQEFGES